MVESPVFSKCQLTFCKFILYAAKSFKDWQNNLINGLEGHIIHHYEINFTLKLLLKIILHNEIRRCQAQILLFSLTHVSIIL